MGDESCPGQPNPGRLHMYFVAGAVVRLAQRLAVLRWQLTGREASQGTSHDVRKMNWLRIEIAKLEARIERNNIWKSKQKSAPSA